jgi:hypothetical protein
LAARHNLTGGRNMKSIHGNLHQERHRQPLLDLNRWPNPSRLAAENELAAT